MSIPSVSATDLTTLSFEDAMTELEMIVRRLEGGQVTLEEAITSYERGAALKAHCETRLRDAKMRVEQIVISADGQVSVQASELQD
jgi:exodeoxyribonuclease VII small subunit